MKKTFLNILLVIGAYVSFAQNTSTESNTVGTLNRVEIEAEFVGGSEAWKQFLVKTLDANIPVDAGAPMGYYTVYCRFIVDKDGTVSNIEILNPQGYGMDQEVLRVIKKSGKWTPALQNNRVVKAYRIQPVTFAVIDEALKVTTPKPGLTIEAKKLNLITIKAYKSSFRNMTVTTSQGEIRDLGNGKSELQNVKGPRVLLTIYKSNNKLVGSVSLNVSDNADVISGAPSAN